MSNTEWTYLLVAGFAWWWLAARLDRLGKQLEAVSHLVRQEGRGRAVARHQCSPALKRKEDR
jgi:hypothetical protein